MKHLKLYEHFDSSDDWKIGDIVVSRVNKYAADTNWIFKGNKYKILGIAHAEISKII